MATDSEIGVPPEMRAYAATTVDQARKAFEAFIDTARRSLGAMEEGAQTAQAEGEALGRRMLGIAEDHVAASFALAQRLVQAETVAEAMALQAAFLDERLSALGAQAGQRDEAGD